ncbi:MAG: hypothetical protein ACREPM_20295 [Gemmatimonadaceae bacterium]
MSDDIRVEGSATVYRLYDIAYAIDLNRTADLLGDSTRGRVRPGRLEARAIQIRNPPLFVSLGTCEIAVGTKSLAATLSAHLFDFGVCSLQLRLPVAPGTTLSALVDFGAALDAAPEPASLFERELRTLLGRITPATERAAVAPLSEEYKVYRVDRITGGDGMPARSQAAKLLTDEQLVALLVGERRRLSAAALSELVPYRFSYYDDDLTVLTWESALIVEPRAEDRDVEYVLEFANAQLLELRMYDLQLDAELPPLYDRVEAARSRRRPRLAGRFRAVLSDLQTRVADVTETVERVENALKVTNDVFLARIYAAALELFREAAWRRGIERKLAILRETYAMLNHESQAARMELLEAAVVVLIVAELLLAFTRH